MTSTLRRSARPWRGHVARMLLTGAASLLLPPSSHAAEEIRWHERSPAGDAVQAWVGRIGDATRPCPARPVRLPPRQLAAYVTSVHLICKEPADAAGVRYTEVHVVLRNVSWLGAPMLSVTEEVSYSPQENIVYGSGRAIVVDAPIDTMRPRVRRLWRESSETLPLEYPDDGLTLEREAVNEILTRDPAHPHRTRFVVAHSW